MTDFPILCNIEDLGKAIPDVPHAISVALPTFMDVIGYEENDTRVTNALKTGYPRFRYHHLIRVLISDCSRRFAKDDELCMPFPSKEIATECISFIEKKTGLKGSVRPHGKGDAYIAFFPENAVNVVKEFWQHTGLILSSRHAESLLSIRDIKNGGNSRTVKDRIAEFSGESYENIHLFPSGMAAFFSAYTAVNAPKNKTIQLGFPYTDSLKIQEKFGSGYHLLKYDGVEDLEALENTVRKGGISAVFCEFTGNPLLQSIDLERLSAFLKAHNIPLIIDDTIGTWHNFDLLQFADITVTSLTKFFSGKSDVMGGSLILNSNSSFYEDLRKNIKYSGTLFDGDAAVLAENSRNFHERMEKINQNAEILCDFLKAQPEIEKIYYPKYVNTDVYNRLKKPGGGYGGLFSIILKNPEKTSDFYDSLKLNKGPNLGTDFTLAIPYTMIAHYHELDLAEKYGLHPNLLRFSVGLEDPKDLIRRFEESLDANLG